MEPPQGDSWVFEGYGSLLRGLIKGLIKGFSAVYTVLVILVILVNFTLKL